MARTPEHWNVEDDTFWEATGKSIANRNLWISIPNLLCGFSVWLYWGMIVKVMQRIHFANPELFNFTFKNDGQPYDEAGLPLRTIQLERPLDFSTQGSRQLDSRLIGMGPVEDHRASHQPA